MFYVRIRKDDVSVKAEITPDNVYTECAGCGHEIPIDLEEMLKDDACDLTATKVFCDEYRIELYDAEHSMDEDRYNPIGMVDNILFVVYTERKNRIRLISARPANSKERSLYYDRYL